MRIAVTGSAGFLGSHTVDRLLALGHTVAGVDNLTYGSRRNFAHHDGNPRFRFVDVDVQHREALDAACFDADAIVHLAGYRAPRHGGADHTLETNVRGTRNVLDVALDTKCKVVLASTADVYGSSPALPFRESGECVLGSPDVPRWAYAAAKLRDEHVAMAYRDDFGLPVVALRLFDSYGPRHHLSWRGGVQSVFMGNALSGEPMVIHGDGLQTRAFTFVSDMVDGIVRATLRDGADGEIVNLGAAHEVSIVDLARTIHALAGTGGKPRLRFVPYEDISEHSCEDVHRRCPDSSRARELLDWRPRVDLVTGLARTIEWHRRALRLATVALQREEPALAMAGGALTR